jgi:methyltransferase
MAESSLPWYLALLAGVAVLRIIELRFSTQHQSRLFAEGATKIPEPFYPLMVGVHVSLLVVSPLEVWLCQRPFLPWLGWPMLALLGGCLIGRIWIWHSLGEQWNVQIVKSWRPIVDSGPYRYVRHPNYTVVMVEMFAFPLVHTAYLTALLCSLLNAFVLWQRIRYEEAVLFAHPDYAAKMGIKPRFLPTWGVKKP